MELRNAIEKASNVIASPATGGAKQSPAVREAVETLVRLLYPFAPHLAEELWERLGHRDPLAKGPWPAWDEQFLTQEEVTLVVQVNGKVRSRLTVPAGLGPEELKSRVLADPAVQRWLAGKPPRDLIVVPNRLVNLVVSS
jgi:leucyl-tRNA synthetase